MKTRAVQLFIVCGSIVISLCAENNGRAETADDRQLFIDTSSDFIKPGDNFEKQKFGGKKF